MLVLAFVRCARHMHSVRADETISSLQLWTDQMKTLLRIFPLVLVLVGATLLFERPAYAYADPGTGLLAIQAVGSALVASGWYLRRKIYALFHRGKPDAPGQEPLPISKDSEGSPLP